MGDQKNEEAKDSGKKDSISIIYHQRNDSPKYFEIKRSKIYLFFIGLPAITLIALIIGAIGLVHTSPFHLMESYRQNQEVQKELSSQEMMEEKIQNLLEQNENLQKELTSSQEIKTQVAQENSAQSATVTGETKCPAPVVCPAPTVSTTINSIGLSTLSLFKPIQGQRDRTRPATLNLSGFKALVARDTVNFQFNIIPAVTDDSKVSGHIIVLMKNELGIQAYPLGAFGGSDFQINYSAGETFATQRFRPVDASFVKPRKSGNYSFTVFIFSRSGDLLHFHTVAFALKL